MEDDNVRKHDEPVKVKRVDALPSPVNAKYWSQHIKALLREFEDKTLEPQDPRSAGGS